MSRGPFFTLKNDKIGKALRLVTGAEARLDLRPLAEAELPNNPPRYPMTVEIASVTLGHYLRQGGSSVTLNPIASSNYTLPVGGTFELSVENEAEAQLAAESTTLAAGLVVATRIDSVS